MRVRVSPAAPIDKNLYMYQMFVRCWQISGHRHVHPFSGIDTAFSEWKIFQWMFWRSSFLMGIADLLGVPAYSKFSLNVAFFVRHEYFLHTKAGNLQELFRESVHINIAPVFWSLAPLTFLIARPTA